MIMQEEEFYSLKTIRNKQFLLLKKWVLENHPTLDLTNKSLFISNDKNIIDKFIDFLNLTKTNKQFCSENYIVVKQSELFLLLINQYRPDEYNFIFIDLETIDIKELPNWFNVDDIDLKDLNMYSIDIIQ